MLFDVDTVKVGFRQVNTSENNFLVVLIGLFLLWKGMKDWNQHLLTTYKVQELCLMLTHLIFRVVQALDSIFFNRDQAIATSLDMI